MRRRSFFALVLHVRLRSPVKLVNIEYLSVIDPQC
jgi:hypothetical protein